MKKVGLQQPGGQRCGEEQQQEPGELEDPAAATSMNVIVKMEGAGRRFRPVLTLRQVSASFHDAPYSSMNRVAIAILNTEAMENEYRDTEAETRRTSLSRFIGYLVAGSPGYQCMSHMLAFPSLGEAVQFGLRLMEALHQSDAKFVEGAPVAPHLVRYGCTFGTYETMGTHPSTGRANYVGPVVNRATRIAGAAELGTVCCGMATKSLSSSEHDISILSAQYGVQVTPLSLKHNNNNNNNNNNNPHRRIKGLKKDQELKIYVCTTGASDSEEEQ